MDHSSYGEDKDPYISGKMILLWGIVVYTPNVASPGSTTKKRTIQIEVAGVQLSLGDEFVRANSGAPGALGDAGGWGLGFETSRGLGV